MRACDILHMLEEAALPLRQEDIAARLKVSKRSVQEDLRHLRQAGPAHGYSLATRRGQGIVLEINDHGAFERYLGQLDAQNAAENISAGDLLQMLLAASSSDGFMSAQELADRAGTSRGTVFAALDSLEELAGKYGLMLERERSRGLRVSGSSRHMKACLAQFLASEDSSSAHAADVVLGDRERVARLVLDALNGAGLEVNYPEFSLLAGFAAATLLLAKNGRTGKELENQSERKDASKFEELASDLVESLSDAFGIALDGNSGPDMAWALSRAVRMNAALPGDVQALDSDLDAFFRDYDAAHGTSYAADRVLRTMLLAHLSFMVERLARKVSYSSPLTREFEITHPASMNMAIRLCSLMEEHLGGAATPDEVMLVACHLAAHDERVRQQILRSYARIAVVCSTGGGGSYLVRLQFESVFPTADVRTFSYQQQEEVLQFDPDLVFSMVPFQIETQIPVIYIHGMLNQHDLSGIRESVRTGDMNPSAVEATVWDLIVPGCFMRIDGSDIADYRQLLYRMGTELEEQGFAQDGFTELVLERESFSSTKYLHGVCIPHPIETNGKRDAIAVAIADAGLLGEEPGRVRIVFMICLTKKSMPLYQRIAKRLYQLMLRPELVEQACQSASSRELRIRLAGMEGVLNA